jgi:hypothetical protein
MENSSQPTPPPPSSPTGCLIGCLIAFVGGIVLLFAAFYSYPYLEEYQHNKFITEKCTEYFNDIKAGGDWCLVIDPLGIEMLVSDEQCIDNLTFLRFIEVDLGDPRYEAIVKLKNLRTLDFYNCHNVEKLFAVMQGMPSVEEMEFDSMRESPERDRLLKTFPNLKKVTYE